MKRKISGINRKRFRYYHLFYSSCLWLKDNGVIDDEDLNAIEDIRKHSNLISHEPIKLLTNENYNINRDLLKKSQLLLSKIEKWWIINFDMQVDSDFDGQEIDEEEIRSGRMVYLDYVMDIVE